MKATTHRDRILLALVAGYAVLHLLHAPDLLGLGHLGASGIAVVLFAIAMVYGAERYGWKRMLVFFGITFAISWSMESLSIATGIPFGHYHYTSNLGPKLGTVPFIIPLAYFGNGFFSWTIASIFLECLGPGIRKANVVVQPIIAAFVMVLWDLSMDPSSSTINQDWIWKEGGAYFGVPIQNYFGWYLTVFLIFQCFALFLQRSEKSPERASAHGRLYWAIGPLTYLTSALPFLLSPFTDPSVPIKYKFAGAILETTTGQIYWSMFLVCSLSMVFVAVLALVSVARLEG